MLGRLWAWLCLVGWLFAMPAMAQNLESVLAPGKLVQGHVKWEEDCKACHVRFDRAAQDKLCMDCHKDVGQDVNTGRGYHGLQLRAKPQACRSCHTDHKGRTARIVDFDPQKFDHRQSDFALRGKHVDTACKDCHLPAKQYRDAASDCNACHKKDDVHKGSLGPRCADCHNESRWPEAKFDHGKTRFALSGKHGEAACGDCHKDKANYKDAPRTCIGCHKKADDGPKGHKGQYGERCDSCHNAKAWKPATFNHDLDTKYALKGQHKRTACADCHTGPLPLYRQKLATDCNSCHKKDDKHEGTLGPRCDSCHSENDWKVDARDKRRFDHDRTDFPLLGKHVETRCDACHKRTKYKEAPKTCIGCHQAHDKHEANLGTDCGACHNERVWKDTKGRFDHDRTRFKLRNAHAKAGLACKACHQSLRQFRHTATDCYSCHKGDDKHETQLGRDCASCHSDRDWKVAKFNHNQTRFALLGRHAAVVCKNCHATPRFKDAPRDCLGCHQKDDSHKQVFGENCASCHNARGWPTWNFDHNTRSRYRLDGAHVKVACEACHTRPAPKGQDAAPLASTCVSCHRKDDVHDGGFGPVCAQCHSTEHWKKLLQRGPRAQAQAQAWPRQPSPLETLTLALGQASHFARSTTGAGT